LVAAALQDVGEAHQVALDVGAGVRERVAHPGLGGQVDHPAGAHLGEEPRHGGAVGEVDALVAVARVPREARQARLLEGDVVVVVDHVEADDGLAPLEQALGDVVADEAGGAGDEVGHG
jgi:hypothetical protein